MSKLKPCPFCDSEPDDMFQGKAFCVPCDFVLPVEAWQNRPHENKIKAEAFEAGYHARDEGTYPDMTYQDNVDKSYSEWVEDEL